MRHRAALAACLLSGALGAVPASAAAGYSTGLATSGVNTSAPETAPAVTMASAVGSPRRLKPRPRGGTTPAPSPAPAPSPVTGTPQPLGGPTTMTLAFRDEFDGSSLDQSAWTPQRGYGSDAFGRPFNLDGEDAGFAPSAVSVGGGSLRLSATSSPLTLPVWGEPVTYPYTSGVVTTEGKKTFTYGFLETRMWVPDNAGYWPAFWMTDPGIALPEVDIAEFFPAWDGKLHPFVNLHWGADWNHHQEFGMRMMGAAGTSYGGGWHTYGVRWAPGVLETYVDGVKGPVIAHSQVPSGPMFLILNLSVHRGATPPPATMLVDYVRVWQ